MAFNLTGENEGLYLGINSAINAAIFSFTILPTLILCILCVMAMFFAKEVNWPMRVLIINILAAEVVYWVAAAFLILRFIPRAFIEDVDDTSCRISVGLAVTSTSLKFSAIMLYAIKVYLFIRYGTKRLKWQVIIPYITTSWIASFAAGIPPFFLIDFLVNNGFCDSNSQSPFSQ